MRLRDEDEDGMVCAFGAWRIGAWGFEWVEGMVWYNGVQHILQVSYRCSSRLF